MSRVIANPFSRSSTIYVQVPSRRRAAAAAHWAQGSETPVTAFRFSGGRHQMRFGEEPARGETTSTARGA